MEHRSTLRTPPPPPLQLPSAAVPPRRRRTPRRPMQEAVPAVPLPTARPVPSGPRRQFPPLLAVAEAANPEKLNILARIAVLVADAEAAAFPPAPAPAGENIPSSPPLPPAAADEDKPYAPQLPPLAVDAPPSSMFTGSSKRVQSGGGVASPAAGALRMQLGDDHEELELGEIPPENPAAACNEDPAREYLLAGKGEEMSALEEEAKTVAEEPAWTGSSAHRAAPTEMSAAEQKRMREVFVGGLSRDATVQNVRAALSAAGEITEVRMIRDSSTREKNKGYCFVVYRDAAMARKAVAEFGNLKICGKPCRVAVPGGSKKSNKIARDPIIEDNNRIYETRQQLSPWTSHPSYIRSWNHPASYVVPPVLAMPTRYIPMYDNGHGAGVYLPAPPPDLNHGLAGPSARSQMGQSAGSNKPAGQQHRSRN